ncbi:MAG: methyltransferase domain-containing protein [Myxococcales bacterium]|nr:methyltransferase domain-containing protein [Myxococcales bacterium]
MRVSGICALSCVAFWATLLHPISETNAEPASRPTTRPTPYTSPDPRSPKPGSRHGDVHQHPPIDCPLRKQGIDPTKLKPFESVQRYIRFLEQPSRAVWQKPDRVVARLKLAPTDRVADVGAGGGYFAFRLAKAVPRGVVYAVDIEPEMLRHIHHTSMTSGVSNIRVVLSSAADPKLPEVVDVVFICDVLHHVHQRALFLANTVKKLRSGGRFVLIEFKEGRLPKGPPEKVKIPRRRLFALARAAGLRLEREVTGLLPYQHFLIFRKP